MYVDLLDVGVEGRLEVDLGLVTWSTDLDFARCTPAKCGEAGKSVSERAGITRSSARALTGEHGSVAHSSKPVRRPPLRRQVCQVLKSVTAGLGTEIVFWDSELLVCVLCDGNKCIYRKSRWLGPRGREVISKSILCFRSTHLTSTPLTAQVPLRFIYGRDGHMYLTASLLRCTFKCSVAHYMFTRSPGDIFRETRLLRRSGEPGKIDTKLYVQPRNLSKRHPALCQGRVFRHTTLRCMSAMERMLVV